MSPDVLVYRGRPRPPFRLRSSLQTAFLALTVFTGVLHGDEMRVSSTRIHLDETVSVTVALSGSYAEVDDLSIPTRNLDPIGSASQSSQFSWVNGVVSRQKIFRYTFRPLNPGTATIGPVIVQAPDGNRQSLGSASIVVVSDIASSGGKIEDLLEEYRANARDPIVITPEVSTTNVMVGQQVVVTWYLYSNEVVRAVNVTKQPTLNDFWVEEIPVTGADASDVVINGQTFRKIAIRRTALFPLRAGRLQSGALEAISEIIKPTQNFVGGIGMFNSRIIDVRRRAAPLVLDVAPAPPTSNQIGRYAITCTEPIASRAGPVSLDVTVEGDGNLRAATAPRFIGAIPGRVEVTEGPVTVNRSPAGVLLKRKWTLLIFPNVRSGDLALPPIGFSYIDPSSRQLIRTDCAASRVRVAANGTAPQEARSGVAEREEREPQRSWWPIALAGAVPLGGLLLFLSGRKRRRERLASRESADAILAHATPRELRNALNIAIEQRAGVRADEVMREDSERGELARSVSSLLEYRSKNPSASADLTDELRERIIELLEELRRK